MKNFLFHQKGLSRQDFHFGLIVSKFEMKDLEVYNLQVLEFLRFDNTPEEARVSRQE